MSANGRHGFATETLRCLSLHRDCVTLGRVTRTPWLPPLFALSLLAGAGCAVGSLADGSELVPPDSTPSAGRPDAALQSGWQADGSSTQGTVQVDGGKEAGTSEAGPPPLPPPPPPAPVVDGTVSAGEYGQHVNGANQQASNPADPNSTTWYANWTDSTLFLAVTSANTAEAVVVYVGSDGATAGFAYDNEKPALAIRAEFVAYVKAGYNEYRTADRSGVWSAPTAGALTVRTAGSTREIAIPWSTIRSSGRPAAFTWLGYATSPGGFVYGAVPSSNPMGAIGTGTAFPWFYRVIDATPGSGTKPFASATR